MSWSGYGHAAGPKALPRTARYDGELGERPRTSFAEARAARAGRPEAATAYEQARLWFELAEPVGRWGGGARREELGLSQRRLAERAGMSQLGIARSEAGGTILTLPLLGRLACAAGAPRDRAGSDPGRQPGSRRAQVSQTQEATENRRRNHRSRNITAGQGM